MPRRSLLIVLVACGGATTSATPPAPAPAPAAPPECAVVADHVRGLDAGQDGQAPTVREIVHARCTQDAWAAAPRVCMLAAASSQAARDCNVQLTAPQRETFEAAIAEARASAWPPRCVSYVAMIEKLIVCDHMPVASRDALRQGKDEMVASWRQSLKTLPEAARAALAQGCQDGADALVREAGKLCGL